MAARSVPPETISLIEITLAEMGGNVTATAAKLKLSPSTISKYKPRGVVTAPVARPDYLPKPTDSLRNESLPDPSSLAGGPSLPEPFAYKPLIPVHVNDPGWWLVLGDTHFPMHDKGTIEAAFREAREKNAVGVLLNGDLMDMFSVSPFHREPTEEGFLEELECGRAALKWMRSRLPNARFILREGNHDFRLRRYLSEGRAVLWKLPEMQLPNLLGAPGLGIEWVQDKRKIYLGKLITLHGHELRKGEGINPARLAFLRTTSTVLVSHYHRASMHKQRSLDDKHFTAWSIGCACYIHPDYDPYNQWEHGYAMVEVHTDGWFNVHNRTVIDGRVA